MNTHVASWDVLRNDPNHNNHGETRIDAVKSAWEGAMELAADAQDRWEIT